MRRITLNYMNEVKAILEKSVEATVYVDAVSGQYVVEYFLREEK